MSHRFVRRTLLALLFCAIAGCGRAPEEGPWVASARGRVYYWAECGSAGRIAERNRVYFPTAEAAREAGYRPSTARGCAGPRGGETADAPPSAAPSPAPAGAGETCTVERVVDGDTLVCRGGERVRLLLVDTPESSQRPFGARARQALLALAPPGTAVRLERDVEPTDRYGRTLAYAWLPDGRMANEEMAREGFAVSLTYPPNVRYVERIRAAVEEARSAGRGLWGTPAFSCLPRDYRARRCGGR